MLVEAVDLWRSLKREGQYLRMGIAVVLWMAISTILAAQIECPCYRSCMVTSSRGGEKRGRRLGSCSSAIFMYILKLYSIYYGKSILEM